MRPLPFNRIVLVERGVSRAITIDELHGMGMHDRISAILEDRLAFFLDAARVELNVALKALRTAAAGTATAEAER